ncbi:hypothetical protein IW148_003745 [Coemansia sp. RSA 1199]|nr:hypothetical protein IW148_003745 [Coemansia sp. RSA 1199]
MNARIYLLIVDTLKARNEGWMLGYSIRVAQALKNRCTTLGAGRQHASRDRQHTHSHICAKRSGYATGLWVDRSHLFRIKRYAYQNKRYSTSDDDKKRLKKMFDKTVLPSYSPFLTKFFQLLPEREQSELRLFSDALKPSRSTPTHMMNLYSILQKKGLHRYLTIHAMQRIMRRVACDTDTYADRNKTQAGIIMGLFEDYASLGFTPGISEYGSLIRALALERGREKEALQLLDSVVDSSDIAPFIRSLKGKRNTASSVADRIPTDEDIERIELALQKAEEEASDEVNPSSEDDLDVVIRNLSETDDLDQIQTLVIDQRRAQQRQQQVGGKSYNRLLQVSREFYHTVMGGFAQIYHIRGVMEILGRMLEPATQVPYRIARYLMPNRVTWEIVGDVMSRQRDRPTFVKLWVAFLSRGARPPLKLTQKLVRLLVHQMCIEQAIWVMRISRCLPDLGQRLPKSEFAADKVPWDLKVRIMHVASALEAATSFDNTPLGREEALRQGRVAMQLPQIEKPDPDIYARLIGGAVRMKSERLAARLFRELVDAGVAPAGSTYGHLAALHAERNQISRVFLIVRNMLVYQHQRITKENIEGDPISQLDQAKLKHSLLRKSSMLQADVECIVPLLRLYVQENQEHEAMALLRSWDLIYKDQVPAEKLIMALLKVYDRPEDTAVASSLLHQLSRMLEDSKSDIDESAKTEDRAETPVVEPASGIDVESLFLAYTQTISTHLRARNIPGVVQVLREILDSGLHPSYSIWEMVMRGFLQEHALDLFDTVHVFLRDTLKMPLSLPLYSQWMRSLHNHGDVVGVQAAFDEMVELGQIPTQQHYLTLVLAYSYSGMLERAVEIVYNLRKPNSAMRPGVMLEAAVVEAYAACGEMYQAETELQRLLDNTHLPLSSIPAQPFNHLIIGYLHSGNGSKAIRTYTEMLRLGVKPNAHTFSVLMHSYAKARNIKNCMRAFNEMIRMEVAPNMVIYTIMIFAFRVVRQYLRADEVFNHVLQEQEWARAQVESRNLFMAGGNIPSSSPDILDMYAMPSRFSQLDSANQLTESEHMRIRNFYNLDPVIYIVMLSLYRRSNRTMWALVTWERFVKNFPIVQWSPREGGVMSQTMHYTSRFHILAWTLVLRTVTKAVRVPLIFRIPYLHVRFFTDPEHSQEMRMRLDQRQQQKLNLAHLWKKFSDNNQIRYLRMKMKKRKRMVRGVETEIDRRLDVDFEFCQRQRYEQPLPDLNDQIRFSGYEYWMPESIDLSRLQVTRKGRLVHTALPIPPFKNRDRLSSPTLTASGEPESSMFTEKGRFIKPTTRDMAAILSNQWRALENQQFKFNNIHVAVYLPTALVGRQYEHLIHFLLQVQPRTMPKEAAGNAERPRVYTYKNIHIDVRTTHLLARQMRVVCEVMLAERDRRVLLTALIGTNKKLSDLYESESVYNGESIERTDDVLRVMQERLVIHSEREISWARELSELMYIARLWIPLIENRNKPELIDMMNMVSKVPHS